MTSFFSINACQFSAQQTMETLVMYMMTFRRLNVALYLTGLVIAYQRSIANSITMATEILPKVKTKYWELRIWQKTSPPKFPLTGKFSSPMTKAGVIASITPARNHQEKDNINQIGEDASAFKMMDQFLKLQSVCLYTRKIIFKTLSNQMKFGLFIAIVV